MTKIFLLLIFAFGAMISFGQNVGQTGDTLQNYTDINGLKQGNWKKTYENGKIQYEAYFVDGKPVGELKRYNNKGDLIATMFYKEGSDLARAILYHKSGKIAAKGNYIGKNKDSIWNYLDDNGICYLIESYNNGKKHGAFKTFTSEKILIEEMNWRNDIKHGEWKKYYVDGKLMFEGTYVNGVLSGPSKTYYKSGVLQKDGSYKNDLMNGPWLYYNENGGLKKVYQFDNGLCPEAEEDQSKETEELLENKNQFEGPQNANDIDWLRRTKKY